MMLILINVCAEHFFFDKFFYRKSAKFGYVADMSNLIGQQQLPASIQHRLSDLRVVIEAAQKDTPVEKLPGVYTIAIIGDSMVYGEGLLERDRFARALERKLNTLAPTKIYVLAQPNDHLLDNFAKYLLAEQYLQPDLYVFGLMNNDLLFDRSDRYPGEKELYVGLKTICTQAEFQKQPDVTMTWEDLITDLYAQTFVDGSANRCFLDVLSRRIMEKNHPVLGLSFFDDPQPNQFTDQMSETMKAESLQLSLYQTVFASAGAKVLYPHEMMGFAYHPVSDREGHPSAWTHAKYTQLLFDEISTYPEFAHSRKK